MDFQVFHRYNKLVRRDLADPLLCTVCDSEYIVALGAFDEPVLKCLTCRSTIYPGLTTYDDLRAAVSQYFTDNKGIEIDD
jgi:hypothetical protein